MGNANTDAFNVSTGVVVTGFIDGAGNSDTLNLSAYASARSVLLTGLGATNGFDGNEASVAGGFDNIDVLNLPAGAGDTLTGANLANVWAVTSGDGGTVTSGGQTLQFTGANSLTGGTNTDDFTLNGGTLSGAIAGGGGAGINTLTGDNVANTWGVTGNDSGSLTGVTGGYSDIDNLVGNANTDVFNLSNGVVVTGSIDGAGNSDTLNLSAYLTARGVTLTGLGATNGFDGNEASVTGGFDNIDVLNLPAGAGDLLTGANLANVWAVTSGDGGTVTSGGQTLQFTGTNSLTGGTNTDDVTLNGGTLSGALAGGGGVGINSLTADNVANTWSVTGVDSGTVTGIASGFSDIDNLIGGTNTDDFTLSGGTLSGSIAGGGGAGVNSLTGDNVVNTWTVTALDTGSVTGVTGGFSDIGNLIGGTSTDAFTLNGGTLSGSIAGGGGAGINTLTGDNVANTWGVTGNDSGSLTGLTAGYTDIDNLVGNANTDVFNLSNGVVVTGYIDGAGNSDTLNLSAYLTARSVTLTGLGATNGFDGNEASVTGGFDNIDVFNLPAGAGDLLTGANLANVWAVTSGDGGTATSGGQTLQFAGANSLTGGTNTDDVVLNGGTLSGALAGGGGAGVNSLTGDNVANTWTITAVDTGSVPG